MNGEQHRPATNFRACATDPPIGSYMYSKAFTHFTIPWRDGGLSRPVWLVTYRDGLPAR